MNETERAVRAAVEKTQAENKLSAAEFKVDRANRVLMEHQDKTEGLRAKVREAVAELRTVKDSLGK